jgi:hypothetical protein
MVRSLLSCRELNSGRVDAQMLQFRRMMKEVEGGTIAKLPAEWQPLARTLLSILGLAWSGDG